MRSTNPPVVATWFLRQLGSGPNNDALLGDLIEQYGQRRSRIWYWRQVFVAIAVSFCAPGRKRHERDPIFTNGGA